MFPEDKIIEKKQTIFKIGNFGNIGRFSEKLVQKLGLLDGFYKVVFGSLPQALTMRFVEAFPKKM